MAGAQEMFVCTKGEPQPGRICHQQYDSRADRHFVHQLDMRVAAGRVEEDRRQQERGDGDDHLTGGRFGAEAVELLVIAFPSADEHRQAADEEEVAENRSRERRPDDFEQSGAHRQARDDHFREVAEGGVEQGARARAQMASEVAGALADERCERDNRERRKDKDGDGAPFQHLGAKRHRRECQKDPLPIAPDHAAKCPTDGGGKSPPDTYFLRAEPGS
jgi:hypothetical protein